MTLRILIVDDEPLARERLRSLVEEIGHEVCGEADNGEIARQLVVTETPDALLLDIEMPGVDGLELCSQLEVAHPELPVVLITAHPEHALPAFDMDVCDYILKPVRKERLERALARLRPRTTNPLQVPVQIGRREELVRLDDIDCFVAEDGYIMARSATLEGFVSLTLQELERHFGPRVMRVHRNCIVVRGSVRAVMTHTGSVHEITFQDGLRGITVSRRQVSHVKRFLRSLSVSQAVPRRGAT